MREKEEERKTCAVKGCEREVLRAGQYIDSRSNSFPCLHHVNAVTWEMAEKTTLKAQSCKEAVDGIMQIAKWLEEAEGK